VVAIFAKPPVPGRVKTRLAAAIGPQQAAVLHMACLQDAVRLVSSIPGVARCLYVAGTTAQATRLARALQLPQAWNVRRQRGADLGARLHHAFAEILDRGSRSAIVMGTDTPWMGSRALHCAMNALHRSDVVLGPSEDGGYYLVGVRRLLPEMFQEIAWGSHRVLRQTLSALARRKIPAASLPLGFDLDRPADLARLRRGLRRLRRTAPALAEAISRMQVRGKA